MKVLITGGTGLIGSALAQDLAQNGHEVIILSRRPQAGNALTGGVRMVQWDGKTAAGWGWLAEGADAIVNLAGANLSAGRWTARRKQAILQSRLNAGAAVVEAVRQAKDKPKAVIQISGVGAYGTSETAEFDESSPYGNDFLSGVSQAWEESTRPVEEIGVRRVVARSGVVFSTKGGALPRLLLPFRFFVGGPLGSGRQWLSWIHLQDEVHALRFLVEKPEARGIFNLSSQPLTNRELSQTLGRLMKRPAWIPVPAFTIRLLFGEMGIMVLEGQRVASRRLQELGFIFRFPDATAALIDLLRREH